VPGKDEKDYSATPLYKKLGVKPEKRVSFVDAPDGFVGTLEMPPGVDIVGSGKQLDVVVVFATRLKDLRTKFARLAEAVFPDGGLWVAYPKKSSTIPTDLNFDNVQQLGLDEGLVDNKSCAIDADYSGVRFVYRLKDR
jgi:hypothetical protein